MPSLAHSASPRPIWYRFGDGYLFVTVAKITGWRGECRCGWRGRRHRARIAAQAECAAHNGGLLN